MLPNYKHTQLDKISKEGLRMSFRNRSGSIWRWLEKQIQIINSMAVHIGLATIIVPRNCIDAVFPGGFEEYRKQEEGGFWNNHPVVGDFVWFDENIVVVDDSMGGAHHIDPVFEYWENLGLDPEVHIGYAIHLEPIVHG